MSPSQQPSPSHPRPRTLTEVEGLHGPRWPLFVLIAACLGMLGALIFEAVEG